MNTTDEVLLKHLSGIQTKISGAIEAILDGRTEQAKVPLVFARNDLFRVMNFLGEAPPKKENKC